MWFVGPRFCVGCNKQFIRFIAAWKILKADRCKDMSRTWACDQLFFFWTTFAVRNFPNNSLASGVASRLGSELSKKIREQLPSKQASVTQPQKRAESHTHLDPSKNWSILLLLIPSGWNFHEFSLFTSWGWFNLVQFCILSTSGLAQEVLYRHVQRKQRRRIFSRWLRPTGGNTYEVLQESLVMVTIDHPLSWRKGSAISFSF